MTLSVRQATLASLDFAAVEIAVEPVAEGVWMLSGAGGNVGVVAGEQGVVLIDAEFAPLAARVLDTVRSLCDAPVRTLVNTHFHLDHTGGNETLGRAGALIVGHGNVRRRMAIDQEMEAMGRTIPAFPEVALPTVTFEESLTLHLGRETLHLVHTPAAHTDGDCVVYLERANVVHMGDLFFNGTYPLVDLGNGGNVEGVIEAVRGVLERADEATRILPGHGPLAGRDELAAYGDMLGAVRDRVAALIEAGKGLEEILDERPTASFDEAWASELTGPEAITTYVYNSLVAGR